MSDFKVGDKVTMYGYHPVANDLDEAYNGEVGTIVDIGSYIEVQFEVEIDGLDNYLLFANEIELIEPFEFKEAL